MSTDSDMSRRSGRDPDKTSGQKIIAIVGATASGKTSFSLALAKAVSGEIISADSRQVYRGLDIGTGKVSPGEMQGIPHHLLDVADPRKQFSAAAFVKRGRAAIAAIAARGRVPLIVGGTGFYIDALAGNIRLADVPANPALRKRLQKKPTEKLLIELARLDLERATTIDGKNRVRLIRAIEIARARNAERRAQSEKNTMARKRRGRSTLHAPRSEMLWLGIALPKDELRQNIRARLHARMEAGMLEEAKRLHQGGLSFKRMKELGLEYRYLARHLQGTLTREEMLLQLESAIRKYARRQHTWFKRNKNIHWFHPSEKEKAIALAREFLTQ